MLSRNQLNGKLDGLMIVADGLGGRRAGEIASSLLVETVSFGVLESTSMRQSPFDVQALTQLTRDVIVRSNGKIMTQGRFHKRSDTHGMATTCVTAIINEGQITIGNVGDSRAYLLRNESLRLLTRDHSEVFEELMKGALTEEEARLHRFRNQITRAVGLSPDVNPDIDTHDLFDGDVLLMCSDGLTTEMPEKEILETLLGSSTPEKACDRLVAHALRNGGRDNITVVVMHYGKFLPVSEFDVEVEAKADEPTDPVQDWRSRSANDPDYDEEWDDAPKPPGPKPSKPIQREVESDVVRMVHPGTVEDKVLRYAPVVAALLVLVILVEAAIMWNLKHRTLPTGGASPSNIAENLPTPGSLTYEAAKTVADVAVQADTLQLTPQGYPIVAKLDGKIVKVLPSRVLSPMGPQFPSTQPQTPATGTTEAKARCDIFFDAAGNMYYINVETKCIETYNRDGTRTNDDLGKGQLSAPSKLIVDNDGNIYVLDSNRLKVLRVKSLPKGHAHPQNADF